MTVFHSGAEEFLQAAGPFLEEREAENNLILGTVGRMSGPVGNASLITIERDGTVVAAAMCTPPFHLVLTDADADAIRELVDAADSRGLEISGVLGPAEAATNFMRMWERRRGVDGVLDRNQCIYQLDRVIDPAPVPGRLRVATDDDLELIAEWIVAFTTDIRKSITLEGARSGAASLIAEGRLYLWENDGPVSMAAWTGKTRNGVRVNYVYTPPQERRKGYASAVVAGLSRLLLESGRKYCFLYTDLSNPTSNSIYQKMGYQPMCDSDQYRFESR